MKNNAPQRLRRLIFDQSHNSPDSGLRALRRRSKVRKVNLSGVLFPSSPKEKGRKTAWSQVNRAEPPVSDRPKCENLEVAYENETKETFEKKSRHIYFFGREFMACNMWVTYAYVDSYYACNSCVFSEWCSKNSDHRPHHRQVVAHNRALRENNC